LCVDSVPVEAVSMALLSTLDNKKRHQAPRIQSVQTVDPGIFPLIADASSRYRSAQEDRARRLEVILELENANQRFKAMEAQASQGSPP
jgi:hypothetical protein